MVNVCELYVRCSCATIQTIRYCLIGVYNGRVAFLAGEFIGKRTIIKMHTIYNDIWLLHHHNWAHTHSLLLLNQNWQGYFIRTETISHTCSVDVSIDHIWVANVLFHFPIRFWLEMCVMVTISHSGVRWDHLFWFFASPFIHWNWCVCMCVCVSVCVSVCVWVCVWVCEQAKKSIANKLGNCGTLVTKLTFECYKQSSRLPCVLNWLTIQPTKFIYLSENVYS